MEGFIAQNKVSYEFPSEIVFEHKFDTAVRNTFLTAFSERLSNNSLTPKDRTFIDLIGGLSELPDLIKDETHCPYLIRHILSSSSSVTLNTQQRTAYNRIGKVSTAIIEIQLRNILKQYMVSNKPIVVDKLNDFYSKVSIPAKVRTLMVIASWISKVIDLASCLRRRKGRMSDTDYEGFLRKNSRYECPDMKLVFTYGDNIMCVQILDQKWVMPAAGILLLHNKLCDLISVLLFAHFSSDTSLPADSYDITKDFVLEMCRLALRYKTKFFTIAKNLEALCIAESIIEHEDWKNNEYLKVLTQDLLDDTGYEYHDSTLQGILRSVSTPLRHELCCLGKICGHPYVDMKEGSKSLYNKTTEVYSLNLSMVRRSICYIKQNYIQNHILKFKKWPPCQLQYGGSKALTYAYVHSRDPWDKKIARKYGEVSIEEMEFVELLPNERFHKLDNIIPYLKDKTITLLRSKVLNIYLNEAATERVPWEKTRLILAYLLNPSVVHNHEDYIDRYESSEDLSDLLDYLVIRIVPKEKELKVKFRGFGCKTYEDRFRSLAQEKNAMLYLDKYSDEQAMTLSELELLRRLSAFRRLSSAYPGYLIMYINVDAQAWNNHFRRYTVDYVMRETLDKIFDTTIFGKTHLAFNKTFFYVPGYPDTFWWDGQDGGIEGLNQDTWVIAYLGQIKTALEGLDVKVHILCKGDDLRLVIAIPPSLWKNRAMSDIKNEIVKRIAKAMKSFGHEIKVQESYGSGVYFAFSKSSSIRNIELPQGFRKIQKCYGANNAFLATLDEYIGSTFSNAHSTCKVEPTVLPSYLVALCWSISYLLAHPRYLDCTDDQLVAMLLVPSMCGGFPIIYLHNMAIRAESDLLSPFFEILLYCRRMYPNVAKCMEYFCVAPVHDVGNKRIMLYKDPYSLPHDRPPLPSSVLRRGLIPVMKRFVKNETVKELMRAATSNDMEIIHNILHSASVLNAKVLSALYSATPEGILQELLSKFESARSINEFYIRTIGTFKSIRMLRKVVKAEAVLQKWRSSRLKGKDKKLLCDYTSLISTCPTKSATKVRATLWGKEVVGITMPPLQHQVSILTAFTNIHSDWVMNNHFSYTLLDGEDSLTKNFQGCYTTGKYRPFLGYTTRNGMTEPTVHFIEKDPILTKIKNLIDLVTWTNTSIDDPVRGEVVSNCREVIALILRSFTTIPLDTLAPFSGVRKSGTIQHHMRAPSFRESIVPNVLSNTYTRISGESNTHIRFRNSKEHFYVNFLHIFCYTTWVMMLELEVSDRVTTPEKIWVVTTDCDVCNTPIREEPIVFNLYDARNLSLHPLAVSKLGELSERILRTSLLQTEDRNYNLMTNGEITNDIAIQGVLQEVVEQTFRAREGLQDRYNVPVMNDEAYQVFVNMTSHSKARVVGQTEFRCIPVMEFCQFISLVVLDYTSYIPHDTQGQTRDMLLAVTPAESLPWFGLMTSIHKSGKLPEVVLCFSRMIDTIPPTCYYNPQAASKYIARYADSLLKLWRVDRPLVILSYYANNHIQHQLRMFLTEKLMLLLNKDFKKHIPKPSQDRRLKQGAMTDLLLELFLQNMVVLSILDNMDIVLDELTSDVIDHKVLDFEGIGSQHLTPVMIDDTLSPDGPFKYIIAIYVDMWAKLGVNHEDYVGYDDWDRVLEIVNNRYMNMRTQIHYTTLSACILSVRTARVETDDDSIDLPDDLQIQAPADPEHIKMPEYNRPGLTMLGADYAEPLVVEPLPDTSTINYQIPLHSYYSIIGSSTGSELRLLQLLWPLELFKDTNIQCMHATCLSDGLGGFSAVITQQWPDSLIIYHTIPEDIESISTAPIAKSLNERAHILSQHLDEGIYDLSMPITYERFKKYNILCDIVTSDLELASNDLPSLNNIVINTLMYYIQVRTRKAIFIHKLPISKVITITKTIDVLLESCLYVSLHSPRSNDSSKYCYVIAVGFRRMLDNDRIASIFNEPSSTRSILTVTTYFKQVRIYIRKVSLMFHGHGDLRRIENTPYISRDIAYQTLPYRLGSLLHDTFGTLCYQTESPDIKGSFVWSHVLDRLSTFKSTETGNPLEAFGCDLVKLIDGYRKALNDKTYHDTGAHRRVVIGKFLTAYTCLLVSQEYRGLNIPVNLSVEDVMSNVNNSIRSFHKRDLYGFEQDLSLTTSDWEYEGSVIRYPSSIRLGFTVGLVFLGTIITHERASYPRIIALLNRLRIE